MSSDRENDVFPLGWVNLLFMNYKGTLRMGAKRLSLWPGEKANPIGTCVSPKNTEGPAINIAFEEYEYPVIFPVEQYTNHYRTKTASAHPPENEQERIALEHIISSDPLFKVDVEAASLLWKHRFYCMTRPSALPKVLLATKWNELDDVIEMLQMLKAWAPMTPEASLELLDANFPDENVRTLAVNRLGLMSDDALLDVLLQLVQVLKYEPYLDSALSNFLLERAIRNRAVGHHFSGTSDPRCISRMSHFGLRYYWRPISRRVRRI